MKTKNLILQSKNTIFATMTKMLSILMFLAISVSSFASVQEDYLSANELYQKGEYDKAIEVYQSIIDKDNLSSDIYYNLGNCYYKIDAISSAILNYEKALKLKPDNEDAIFNLAIANRKTTDKIDRVPELFIENTWRNLVTSKTVNSWAIYAVGLIFLSLFFFVSYLLSHQKMIKKVGFYAGTFFLTLSLSSIVMSSQHDKIIKKSSEAIIFTQTVTIKSEPSLTSQKLFTLHEGTKVKLLENVNDWSKIQLPNGNVGWILSEDIKVI